MSCGCHCHEVTLAWYVWEGKPQQQCSIDGGHSAQQELTVQAQVAQLHQVSIPHQQLRGDNAQSAQQGPARVDDLNFTVASKSLRVSSQAGSVPAIVSCMSKDITASSCSLKFSFAPRQRMLV